MFDVGDDYDIYQTHIVWYENDSLLVTTGYNTIYILISDEIKFFDKVLKPKLRKRLILS